jgi:hypothetical protein
LFSQKNTVCASNTPAKLSPSWKSPSLVAPSPKQQTAAQSASSRAAYIPAPAAWGIWEAIGTACGNTRSSWSEWYSGKPRRNRRMSAIGTPRAI